MNERCRGCKLKQEDCNCICLLDENKYFKDIINKCPCQTCLIKGICESHCESFIYYLYNKLVVVQKELNIFKVSDLQQKFYLIKGTKLSRLEIALCFQNYNINQEKYPTQRYNIYTILMKIKIREGIKNYG